MLEEACLAVESDAKKGGVYPEVLFSVARNWFDLYEARNRHQARHGARRLRDQTQDHQIVPDLPNKNINICSTVPSSPSVAPSNGVPSSITHGPIPQQPPISTSMANLHSQPPPVSKF